MLIRFSTSILGTWILRWLHQGINPSINIPSKLAPHRDSWQRKQNSPRSWTARGSRFWKMGCLQILCRQVIHFLTFFIPYIVARTLKSTFAKVTSRIERLEFCEQVFIEEPKTTTAMAVAMGSLLMLFFLLRRNGSIVALCVCVYVLKWCTKHGTRRPNLWNKENVKLIQHLPSLKLIIAPDRMASQKESGFPRHHVSDLCWISRV